MRKRWSPRSSIRGGKWSWGVWGRSEAPFSQGALVKFRARMIAHDLDQKLLDRTVAWPSGRAVRLAGVAGGAGLFAVNGAGASKIPGICSVAPCARWRRAPPRR